MLYNDIAPLTLSSAPKRKFVGSRFDRMLLGISGTDEYGNTTGWGKAKGVVLPALYGTLGAIGTTVAGLGPGVGAKFGSQLGSGINSLTNSFGNNLLEGTDGKESFENQAQSSAATAQTVSGVMGTLGGLFGQVPGLGTKTPVPSVPTSTAGSPSVLPAVSQQLPGGGSAAGPVGIPGIDFEEDPLQAYKQQMGLGYRYSPLMFKSGGEVPVWVKSLNALGQKGLTGYNGQVYDISNLPAESDNTRVDRPQLAQPSGLETSVINRLTNAENSRYDQKNNVGPGHYGKYQFEPMLISKYAGVTPDEFLKSPQLQELAMRRRLADLRTEAESALRKTNSRLPLEDTMVLVHFKGLPQAMKELQNPEMMNRATKHNPSSNTYLYHRSFKESGAKPSVAGYMSQFMQSLMPKGYAKGGETAGIYDDNDDTEDYFMTDKKTAAEIGLLPVLEKVSFGQARFNERIFDQKSNAFMKGVILSNKPQKEKVRLLGGHVAKELMTHSDIKEGYRLGGPALKFKGGGEVKLSKLSPAQRKYLLDEFGVGWQRNDNDLLISSLQAAGLPYAGGDEKPTASTGSTKKPLGEDLWAGITKPLRELGLMGGLSAPVTPPPAPTPNKPLPDIKIPMLPPTGPPARGGAPAPAGGMGSAWMFFRDPANVDITKRTQEQIAARQRQLGFKPIKADGSWGDESEMAYQQLAAIDGNNLGIGRDITKVPTPQGVKVMARPWMRPGKQTLLDGLSQSDPVGDFVPQVPNVLMNPAPTAPTATSAVAPPKPVTAPSTTAAPAADRIGQLGQLAGYLPDVGRLILGGTLARNNQPRPFSLGQEYFRTKAELENRRNTGLSPEQRALYTNGLTANYAAGSEALRSAVAGGASTGAFVAGLGRLGSVYNQGISQLGQLEADQRRQNYGAYANFMNQDLNIRQGMFNREEAIRGANRAAGGALMAGAIDNAQQRYDFNRQYGPGSQYAQMSGYMSNLYKESLETQHLQNQAFKRSLTRVN